ncbi:hypothetical protein L345_08845, partial [Ophiophagus hannah]
MTSDQSLSLPANFTGLLFWGKEEEKGVLGAFTSSSCAKNCARACTLALASQHPEGNACPLHAFCTCVHNPRRCPYLHSASQLIFAHLRPFSASRTQRLEESFCSLCRPKDGSVSEVTLPVARVPAQTALHLGCQTRIVMAATTHDTSGPWARSLTALVFPYSKSNWEEPREPPRTEGRYLKSGKAQQPARGASRSVPINLRSPPAPPPRELKHVSVPRASLLTSPAPYPLQLNRKRVSIPLQGHQAHSRMRPQVLLPILATPRILECGEQTGLYQINSKITEGSCWTSHSFSCRIFGLQHLPSALSVAGYVFFRRLHRLIRFCSHFPPPLSAAVVSPAVALSGSAGAARFLASNGRSSFARDPSAPNFFR